MIDFLAFLCLKSAYFQKMNFCFTVLSFTWICKSSVIAPFKRHFRSCSVKAFSPGRLLQKFKTIWASCCIRLRNLTLTRFTSTISPFSDNFLITEEECDGVKGTNWEKASSCTLKSITHREASESIFDN